MSKNLFVFEDTILSLDLFHYYVENSEIKFERKDGKTFSFSLEAFGEIKNGEFYFNNENPAVSVVEKILNTADNIHFWTHFRKKINDVLFSEKEEKIIS